MRFVALIVFLVLGGCASQGPQTKAPVPAFVEKVEPVSLDLFSPLTDDPYVSYVQPLLRNLGKEPFYQLVNGKRLDQRYIYSHQIQESDPKKTVFAFSSKDGGYSGYITTGIGNQAIANAFFIQNEQVGAAYALVLKKIKICLVTQSEGLPEYRGQRWYFPDAPGYFECTGLTNKNIFKLGTGLPSVLGPYYEEKDTILVFRQFSELQQVVQSLKQQFPYLKVPVIHIR
ncbi:MAG: hypothetical protein JXR18_12680 [Neptuniibacter sp.]